VVDRLTKYSHFIPLHIYPYTAATVAKLFVDQVVKLHGVPLTIISDQDNIYKHFLEGTDQSNGHYQFSYCVSLLPFQDTVPERAQFWRHAKHHCC
jgi:hypothetical protein